MATKKKLLEAAAGSAGGGAGLNVEEVFSTDLWEGSGSSRNIVNNIDLSNEGGLVWIKNRDGGDPNWLVDSTRTLSTGISTNDNSIYSGYTNRVTTFRTDGYRIGNTAEVNASNGDGYVGWTFRKAENFFDVVAWDGDGTNGREISHNLGSVPGAIFLKSTDTAIAWQGYHRYLGATKQVSLSQTGAANTTSTSWNDTEPTDTHFTVGTGNNTSGRSYVAMIFAHHNGDGTFGPTGDQDIIHCGDYTTSNSGTATETIGFEPQWILRKRVDSTQNWAMYDTFRGWSENNEYGLIPNLFSSEGGHGNQYNLKADGFTVHEHSANAEYIYVAIRRGNMAIPESGTDVFNTLTWTGNGSYNRTLTGAGFFPDFALTKRRSATGSNTIHNIKTAINTSRQLRGVNLEETSPDREVSGFKLPKHMDGLHIHSTGTQYFNNSSPTFVGWLWKRANGFCDCQVYTGNGTARTINHNLQATPEMMWCKDLDNTTQWRIWHKSLSATQRLQFDTGAAATTTSSWNGTLPTDTVFSVGADSNTNSSGALYSMYLFASVPGVSIVSSYTGDGTDGRVIDCGFSSSARFVLIKATSGAGDWAVFDSQRGITTTLAYRLRLNSNATEVPSSATPTEDYHNIIEPHSSGFIVNDTAALDANISGKSYIFYAIA